MEDQIEVADTIYPRGVVMTMGEKQGSVALHIQDGEQHQGTQYHNGFTNVAIPHDQMLLAVVAPWFASLDDAKQKEMLRTLYERREQRFPRQPRPVEMDEAPNDFALSYLQEKGWIWHPTEQGKTPVAALLYHDGLSLRTEQAIVTIPKDAVLELVQWVIKQTEWFDPQGASYQADPKTEFADYSECVYCLNNLPHTEQQHAEQIDLPSLKFYDDGVSPDPIDGQW